MIPWLPPEPIFPPPNSAPPDSGGLLAAGGDLSPQRLLNAYQQGIFPWYSSGDPILWWSPDPRMVLRPNELKISRAFGKVLRNQAYEVRLDTAFARVMAECAAAREGQSGTWITPEIQAAYCQLHELGFAHSVETWVNDELVGGLYGVALGQAFYGESMFSRQSNASKIAFAHLCAYLQRYNFGIIDCQMETAHLNSLGAYTIPRSEFSALLQRLTPLQVDAGWEADAINNVYRTQPGNNAGRP